MTHVTDVANPRQEQAGTSWRLNGAWIPQDQVRERCGAFAQGSNGTNISLSEGQDSYVGVLEVKWG